jgi:hypothetical protein
MHTAATELFLITSKPPPSSRRRPTRDTLRRILHVIPALKTIIPLYTILSPRIRTTAYQTTSHQLVDAVGLMEINFASTLTRANETIEKKG